MRKAFVNRNQIENMVKKYRESPAGGMNPNSGETQNLTQFVHFTLDQFFELLLKNKIITTASVVDSIIQQKSNFGVKLYFAQHVNSDDCPDNDSSHVGRNTIVMVNTVQKNAVWYDVPDVDNTIDEIQEYVSAESGSGLDKGVKCPPECPPFQNSL